MLKFKTQVANYNYYQLASFVNQKFSDLPNKFYQTYVHFLVVKFFKSIASHFHQISINIIICFLYKRFKI